MRVILSMALATTLAACAGPNLRPQGGGAPHERWQGYLLRNGLRAPVSLELTESGPTWDGRLSVGDNAVPLADVRVGGHKVHFELPGEGSFDGAVAGNSMAGSVSGATSGSFALTRVEEAPLSDPYPNGP